MTSGFDRISQNILSQILTLSNQTARGVVGWCDGAEETFSVGASCNLDYILFYPITLEGRQGTTDEFAIIPFHLVLFSAALFELAKSIPVHALILSSHLFLCLPLFLFPFTVPCRIVFAKPEDLDDMAKPS